MCLEGGQHTHPSIKAFHLTNASYTQTYLLGCCSNRPNDRSDFIFYPPKLLHLVYLHLNLSVGLKLK